MYQKKLEGETQVVLEYAIWPENLYLMDSLLLASLNRRWKSGDENNAMTYIAPGA